MFNLCILCDHVGAKAAKEETLELEIEFTTTLQADPKVRHLCILNSFKLHELDYALCICVLTYLKYIKITSCSFVSWMLTILA
jgi:hypothetical protein